MRYEAHYVRNGERRLYAIIERAWDSWVVRHGDAHSRFFDSARDAIGSVVSELANLLGGIDGFSIEEAM